jgi:hypothetical protein
MGAVGRNGGRFLRRSVSRETSARAGAGDRRLAILQNNPMNEKIIQ